MPYQPDGTAEFVARFRDLAAQGATELARLDRESSDARMLMKQLSTEVDRFGARIVQLRGKQREMELNLNNYERTDIRDLFDSLLDTQTRHLTMQGQLDQLRVKEQGMVNLQQMLNRVLDLAATLPAETEPRTYGLAPAGSAAAEAGLAVGAPSGRLNGREQPAGPAASGALNGHGVAPLLRVISAQENERQLVSRQIHDGPAQALANLILRTEICERLLNVDVTRAKSELAGLKSLVTTTLQDTRRFINDLRPMTIDDLGLHATLRRYAQAVSDRTKIPVTFSVEGSDERLPGHLEVALFRIAQEAIANAVRHGSPTSIQVKVARENQQVTMTIVDDGVGFDVNGATAVSGERKMLGLTGIRERSQAIGGELQISSEPGRGATITVTMSLAVAA